MFAYLTIKSQREQIAEQRRFIAEQSRNLALEREELKATAAERRARQARLIGMEVHRFHSAGAPANERGQPILDTFRIRVVNASTEPIHDVAVHFGVIPASSWVQLHLVFDHAVRRLVRGSEVTNTPLAPLIGADLSFEFESLPGMAIGSGQRTILTFRDNAGVGWRRDEHGDLAEWRPGLMGSD